MHLHHLFGQVLGFSSWVARSLEALERLLKSNARPTGGDGDLGLVLPYLVALTICNRESGRSCYLEVWGFWGGT